MVSCRHGLKLTRIIYHIVCERVYSVFGCTPYNWQSYKLFASGARTSRRRLRYNWKLLFINIFDNSFVFALCPRIIGNSIMKFIKNRPKWVGEAVSSFHDSRRKKTFYR